MPDSSIHAIAYRYHADRPFYGYRGLYDYVGPRAGYGTPGMTIDGIRMCGAPGMAIIEVAYLSTNTVIL